MAGENSLLSLIKLRMYRYRRGGGAWGRRSGLRRRLTNAGVDMADPLNLRTITEFFGVSPAHESAGDGEWAYEVEDGGFRLTIRVQEIRKHIDIALFHGRSIIASIAGEGMASAEVLSDDEGPYLSVSCEIDLVRSEATIRRKPHIFVAWRAFP